MTDDAKEWVTIKVPKTVRDDARDDPRTYGEIMRAGIDDTPTPNAEIPDGVVRSALYDALDGVEVANSDDTAQRIIGRIDDLETELTRQHEGLKR